MISIAGGGFLSRASPLPPCKMNMYVRRSQNTEPNQSSDPGPRIHKVSIYTTDRPSSPLLSTSSLTLLLTSTSCLSPPVHLTTAPPIMAAELPSGFGVLHHLLQLFHNNEAFRVVGNVACEVTDDARGLYSAVFGTVSSQMLSSQMSPLSVGGLLFHQVRGGCRRCGSKIYNHSM